MYRRCRATLIHHGIGGAFLLRFHVPVSYTHLSMQDGLDAMEIPELLLLVMETSLVNTSSWCFFEFSCNLVKISIVGFNEVLATAVRPPYRLQDIPSFHPLRQARRFFVKS